MKRFGATDEDLKNLGKTIKGVVEDAEEMSDQIRRGFNFTRLRRTLGMTRNEFLELGVIQQKITTLQVFLTEAQAKNTIEGRRQAAIISSLIKGLQELGGAQEIVGAISRNLNLSSAKTAD